MSSGMKRKHPSNRSARRDEPGSLAQAGGRRLVSYSVGALPILNRVIDRARIEEFLRKSVHEDKRCTISPVTGALILLKNYLLSREPIYGICEWAEQHVPELLGVSAEQVTSLNDDRVGRCLDRLFEADCPALVLELTRHVVEEFDLDLSEIHNDSTTITFSGAYNGASQESRIKGKTAPAITWGHNKDHRSDLKQLLYNLTVSADGAVPVIFGVENGNVTDDKTHVGTWEFLCKIIGGPDFLYVADSKLATHANMTYLANRGGRFISVLPRTRSEDRAFRKDLIAGKVQWEHVDTKYNDHGEPIDVISIMKQPAVTSEGFRLLWFHSTHKVQLDRTARANKIRRGFAALAELRAKLQSPRTRYREKNQIERAAEKRLSTIGAAKWVRFAVSVTEEENYVQETPGRPGPKTRYRKDSRPRFDLIYDSDHEALEEAEICDGLFPLVTNERDHPVKEVLAIYKRQSYIEKRFSQLKTQFEVAPVFLKRVRRIVALLTVYYLALLVQALVERELRLAMERNGLPALPLYPEGRACTAPTTRRLIDVFQNIQLHEMTAPNAKHPVRFATELSPIQLQLLDLLEIPRSDYEA